MIRSLRFDDFAEHRLYNKDECCVRRTMTKVRFTGFVNDTRVDVSFNPTDDTVIIRQDNTNMTVSNIIMAKVNAEYKRGYDIKETRIGEYLLLSFSERNDTSTVADRKGHKSRTEQKRIIKK